jgi:hypothetical protein
MTNDNTLVTQEELFLAKELRRRELANKSVEEKFLLLLKLQKMTSEVAKQAGRNYQKPWHITVPSKPATAEHKP